MLLAFLTRKARRIDRGVSGNALLDENERRSANVEVPGGVASEKVEVPRCRWQVNDEAPFAVRLNRRLLAAGIDQDRGGTACLDRHR